MALETYTSRSVNVSWAGIGIEGFAPDSFIELQYNADVTDEEVGADGQVSISMLPDNTGLITLTLQQVSPSNIDLSAVLNTQKIIQTLIRGDMTITDKSGSITAQAMGCHIKTAPSMAVGSSAAGNSRVWVFFVEHLVFFSATTSAAKGLDDNNRLASIIGTIT